MSTETNEMDSGYADMPHAEMPPGGMEITLAKDGGAELAPGMENNGGISMENPTVQSADVRPELVSVYASSITPVAAPPESTLVYFDVLFAVSMTDEGNDQISTHQVVKRIGIDKMKLAHTAKMTTPTIVEAKKPSIISASKARLKELAGVK